MERFTVFLLTNIKKSFIVVLLLFLPKISKGADTIETWEPGWIDLEMYVGYDGAGLPSAERNLNVATVIGFGLVPRLSAYVAAEVQAKETLNSAETALSAVLFGTPIETSLFDLDLLLDFTVSGPDFNLLNTSPYMELNWDIENFGFYLRTGVEVGGISPALETEQAAKTVETFFFFNPGVYVTIRDKHQLLLEYDGAVRLAKNAAYEQGGLAFGYNLAFKETLELIQQIYLSLPTVNEMSVGYFVGFIASLGTR